MEKSHWGGGRQGVCVREVPWRGSCMNMSQCSRCTTVGTAMGAQVGGLGWRSEGGEVQRKGTGWGVEGWWQGAVASALRWVRQWGAWRGRQGVGGRGPQGWGSQSGMAQCPRCVAVRSLTKRGRVGGRGVPRGRRGGAQEGDRPGR